MPLLNKHGWKLIGSFSAMVGRFNTVLDLWELPNPNAVESLLSDSGLREVRADDSRHHRRRSADSDEQAAYRLIFRRRRYSSGSA